MLICVGLAVDYAAHIAHMFKDGWRTSLNVSQSHPIWAEGKIYGTKGLGNRWEMDHLPLMTMFCLYTILLCCKKDCRFNVGIGIWTCQSCEGRRGLEKK